MICSSAVSTRLQCRIPIMRIHICLARTISAMSHEYNDGLSSMLVSGSSLSLPRCICWGAQCQLTICTIIPNQTHALLAMNNDGGLLHCGFGSLLNTIDPLHPFFSTRHIDPNSTSMYSNYLGHTYPSRVLPATPSTLVTCVIELPNVSCHMYYPPWMPTVPCRTLQWQLGFLENLLSIPSAEHSSLNASCWFVTFMTRRSNSFHFSTFLPSTINYIRFIALHIFCRANDFSELYKEPWLLLFSSSIAHLLYVNFIDIDKNIMRKMT